MSGEDLYLIWSNEHRGWWAPGKHGYTRGLRGAGRYDRDTALEICRDAIMTSAHLGYISEIPVNLADVEAFIAGQNLPKAMTYGDWES